MLDNISEEFTPTEVITILVERKYKIKRELVKQVFEIPVLVIRNTGKAILVTKEDGSSWVNGKKGEALWLPSFAMDSVGSRKYKIRYDKIDAKDFDKFVRRFGYEPLQESLNEGVLEKMFSNDELHSKKPFKVIIKRAFRNWRTKESVLQTYEFDACVVQHTDKAVCLAEKGSSFHASSTHGNAFWIPLYALKRQGNDLLIYRPKADITDMLRFLKQRKIQPTEEPLNESILSFTEFILESVEDSINEREYVGRGKIIRAKNNVQSFLDGFGRDNYNEYLMSDIEDGVKNAVNIVFSQVEQDIELLIKNNEGSQLVRRYNLLHDAYLAKEIEVSTIRSCVKVGEKQESAIKKLSKMSKTLKYFNLESMKATTHYFDPMTEDDILEEIEKFNGQVKFRGAMDFFVEFKNGKVFKTYF